MSRGIANNDPGNIRHVSGVVWRGQADLQTDSAFVQFTDPIYGIRAMVRIFRSYKREGIRTLQRAINRWAPPNENDSTAYVTAVCKDCHVAPGQDVDLDRIMPALVSAVIWHENGSQPFSDAQIAEGIALA